ncbi:Uu.00g029300.m01.CDS01 [Anthostomella pinea]|uniref:Uu.00g029300.m01.CDS01 n=1 Tax=Anthostomella pinea TaxID=933095 RepID=A0AAI8V8K4_9PEZI|nr:Uu.00g029300.m01.CDS01 [Anthostomella pinea]
MEVTECPRYHQHLPGPPDKAPERRPGVLARRQSITAQHPSRPEDSDDIGRQRQRLADPDLNGIVQSGLTLTDAHHTGRLEPYVSTNMISSLTKAAASTP